MKKGLFVMFLFLSTLGAKPIMVGGGISLIVPQGSEIRDYGSTFSLDVKGNYRFTPVFSMDAGLSYFRLSQGNARISLIPVYSNAIFDIPVYGQITPYLALGIGLYSGDYKASQWLVSDTDRNFGLQLAGGIHFNLGKYVVMRLKISYTLLELFSTNMLCDHQNLEIAGMYKIQ